MWVFLILEPATQASGLAWILEPGLILPNVFGSPTMVAAVFNFKDWAAHLKTRFHQFPSNTPNG